VHCGRHHVLKTGSASFRRLIAEQRTEKGETGHASESRTDVPDSVGEKNAESIHQHSHPQKRVESAPSEGPGFQLNKDSPARLQETRHWQQSSESGKSEKREVERGHGQLGQRSHQANHSQPTEEGCLTFSARNNGSSEKPAEKHAVQGVQGVAQAEVHQTAASEKR